VEIALHHLLRGEPVHLQLPLCIGLSPSPASGSAGRTPEDWPARQLPLPPLRPRLAFAVGAQALAQAPRIRRLVERHGIPVVTDMVARGLLDERTELAFGHAGFMPDPRVMAIADPAHPLAAEQVLLVGASPSLLRIFAPPAVVLPNALEPDLSALERSLAEAAPQSRQARRAWVREVSALAPRQSQAPAADDSLDHATIARVLADMAPATTAFVIDAGGFHLSATTHLRASRPHTILTQSALVVMGWSCGAAIGASIADPTAPVVALLGDGSFAMHGLELATALRYHANITYVIAWNGTHSSVARDHGCGAMAAVAVADPAAVVQACRLPCQVCASVDALRTAFQKAASTPGPEVIVARVSPIGRSEPARPTGIDWLDGTVGRW
jgi:thiamine pyrophosphate-dependent acetolactate synthase large subunit-like protein